MANFDVMKPLSLQLLDRSIKKFSIQPDFEIRIYRSSFTVHRLVICCSSKYFREKLEKRKNSMIFLKHKDISSTAVCCLLLYMYTGIFHTHLSSYDDVLRGAEYLGIPTLQKNRVRFSLDSSRHAICDTCCKGKLKDASLKHQPQCKEALNSDVDNGDNDKQAKESESSRVDAQNTEGGGGDDIQAKHCESSKVDAQKLQESDNDGKQAKECEYSRLDAQKYQDGEDHCRDDEKQTKECESSRVDAQKYQDGNDDDDDDDDEKQAKECESSRVDDQKYQGSDDDDKQAKDSESSRVDDQKYQGSDDDKQAKDSESSRQSGTAIGPQ